MGKKHRLYVIIIVVFAFVVFWKTFDLYFVADDFVFVKSARDLSFRDLLNVADTLDYPGFPIFLYERFIPLFVLFKVDYTIFEQNAAGYHFTNLLLHILCCIGVYTLSYLLTKHKEVSLVSGLFFVSHYAHVGGIAFIANRQAPTACVFYLFAVISYILYVQHDRKRVYYFLTLVGYIGAVLSYEIGLTLPVIFLIYEFLFVEDPPLKMIKACLVRYIPFAVIAGIYLVLYRSVQIEKQQIIVNSSKLVYPIRYTLDLIVPFASSQFTPYVVLRSFLKSQLENRSYPIMALLGIVLLLIVGGVGYLLFKSSKVIKFFVAWIYVTLSLAFLAPYYAESLIYIPSVGFCIGLAVGLFHICERGVARKSYQQGLKIGIIGAILIMYFLVTYTRISWWAVGGERTKHIISGIEEKLATVPPDNCIFLVNPPGHYNFVVPTFLNDEDLTSALQLAYNDSTILADRIFSQNGTYRIPQRIEISFGSRDCEPNRTYVFQYENESIQRVF